MNTQSRIASILKANTLESAITGLPTFDLSALGLEPGLDFPLPDNLRLGHLAESIVSRLIHASTTYTILYENVQVAEGKQTIGELDFIIEEVTTKQVIHMELAYKFYLLDPSISSEPIRNWIGPNRNDSLIEKLAKTKRKQFPLLYHDSTKAALPNIAIEDASQALCLLVSLFIPYEYKASLNTMYEKAVKGYYLNLEQFASLDTATKSYYIPSKKEWGMDPSENEIWTDFRGIEAHLNACMETKQCPLCWQKQGDAFVAFFVVWW
ncbi:MAG: DUF1853 family protein [Bacteroidia bacterium]